MTSSLYLDNLPKTTNYIIFNMSEVESKSDDTEMKIDPARAKVLVENLTGIKSRVQAANKSGRDVSFIFIL